MTWDLSRRDWQERLKSGRSLLPDLPSLYRAEGDRAVAVFNKLRLADVDGTPTLGEAGGEWFAEIVRAIFGSTDPVTRVRHIRELFLLVPKKNSKTTNGALLMLTALLLNRRPRAPYLMAGPVQKTADDAFSAVAGAIELDPVLQAKLHVRDHLKTIVHRETNAKLEIITFEPSIVTGKKVVGALLDEIHVLGKMPRADKALLQLRGGMQPFPEAFLAMITTQSDEPPAGVFKDELQKARAIRDGKHDSAMLPVLYEFPEEMQRDPAKPWRDPANWRLVTPNVGRSILIERLVQDLADEEPKGEAALRTWASQHLNVEIGLALRFDAWAGASYWEKNAQKGGLTLKELLRRSDVVTAGIDGGGLDDLLGLVFLGRDAKTGQWLHWAHAWASPEVLERRKSEASKLLDFKAAGDLTIADIGKDVEQVADYVEQVEDSGLLDCIGVDQAGIMTIVNAIVAKKIDFDRIKGIPQGWKLVGAIKTTERRLAEGALLHGGTGLMAYSVGNAKVEPHGNAIAISKQVSGSAKIDPLMATFDAVALMSMNPQPRKKKYEIYFA